jgi:hypothetical protein
LHDHLRYDKWQLTLILGACPERDMAASIFISYAHEDRARAEQLTAQLTAAGWSVWWDRQIVGGSHFDRAIEEALAAAKVVVVLWSHASVASQWVRGEAAWALQKGKLLPVMIDIVDRPVEFFHVQTIDFAGRSFTEKTSALTQLLTELAQRLGGERPTPRLPPTGGRSPGYAGRALRARDTPRGIDVRQQSEDQSNRPAFSPLGFVATSLPEWRKGRPLLLLGGVLAALVIGASYFIFSDSTPGGSGYSNSAPSVKPATAAAEHPPLGSPNGSGTTPNSPAASTENKNYPWSWSFKPP